MRMYMLSQFLRFLAPFVVAVTNSMKESHSVSIMFVFYGQLKKWFLDILL